MPDEREYWMPKPPPPPIEARDIDAAIREAGASVSNLHHERGRDDRIEVSARLERLISAVRALAFPAFMAVALLCAIAVRLWFF